MMSEDSGHEICENFIDNVDEDVLFVDDSIDYELNVKAKVVIETEPVAAVIGSEVNGPRSSICCETPPLPLGEQISLPIKDVPRLCFYETFMISDKLSSDSLTPKADEIEEIGNATITVEEFADGKFSVFSSIQMLIGCKQLVFENLSVVDTNLKLVHEKRIQRLVAAGKFEVD
jgi:hypothetical protein